MAIRTNPDVMEYSVVLSILRRLSPEGSLTKAIQNSSGTISQMHDICSRILCNLNRQSRLQFIFSKNRSHNSPQGPLVDCNRYLITWHFGFYFTYKKNNSKRIFGEHFQDRTYSNEGKRSTDQYCRNSTRFVITSFAIFFACSVCTKYILEYNFFATPFDAWYHSALNCVAADIGSTTLERARSTPISIVEWMHGIRNVRSG